MGWLEDLCAHLDVLGHGLWRPDGVGGTIFDGWQPADPDVCLAVYPGVTGESDSGLGYDAVGFQVRSRHMTAAESRLMLEAVYDDLHGADPIVLPSGELSGIYAIQTTPIPLGPDANRRYEHTLNFRAERHNPRPTTRR